MTIEQRVEELERQLANTRRELAAVSTVQNALRANGLDELFSKNDFQPKPFLYLDDTLTIDNTTTETDLISIPLESRRLGFKGGLRITLAGTYINATGSNRNIRFRCKLGSTTMWNAREAIPTEAATHAWRMVVEIMAGGSMTEQQLLGQFMFSANGAADNGFGRIDQNGWATPFLGSATEDLTTRSTFSVTFEHGAAVSGLILTRTKAFAEEM